MGKKEEIKLHQEDDITMYYHFLLICKKPWNLRKYSLKMQGCPCQGIERHIPRMMMKGIYILLYSSELDIISSNVQNRKQKCEIYMKFSSVDQASHHVRSWVGILPIA